MGWKEFWGIGRKEDIIVPVTQQEESVVPEVRAHSFETLDTSRFVVGITPKEAAKIGTVWRAVNIISTMISQMDVKVYRGEKEVKYVPLLMREPIEGESFSSFVQQAVWSLALWGNCYIKLLGDPDKPTSVKVLDPEDVVCREDAVTEKVTYWVKGKQVNPRTIRHLKFERLPGEAMGHGPLTGASGELKAAYMLDKFQRQWFDVTGAPKGVISTDTQLNPENAQALQDAWVSFLEKNHQVIVMPKGVNFQPVSMKPVEAQYVDVVATNIRNIARIFGIPAANLLSAVDGTSMTYTNYVESNIMFIQNTLSRYVKEIEDFLTTLLPRGQKVKFDEETLLRLSPEKLWAIKKIQHEVGYYSGAEQREEEGKKPLPALNFDTEGTGANALGDPEAQDPKGDVDSVKTPEDPLGIGFPAEPDENGKRTRCINDGVTLDGKETLFCSRKCKDEWHAKNKNKGAIV